MIDGKKRNCSLLLQLLKSPNNQSSSISVNRVTPGYTATDLNQFQGAKTAEQGAMPIVQLAIKSDPERTVKFFKDWR